MGMVHAERHSLCSKGFPASAYSISICRPFTEALSPAENVRFKMQMRKEFEGNQSTRITITYLHS